MATSARVILHSTYLRTPNSPFPFLLPRPSRQHLPPPHRFPSLSLFAHNHLSPKFTNSSFPIFRPSNFSISATHFNRLLLGNENSLFRWNFAIGATDRGNRVGVASNDSEVAVVMLGWLGAKPKHLKRYVEMYNAKGIHAVTFVASVLDVLSFDLGKKLEERVLMLANELAAWLSDHGSGGDRSLVFHTFSNTGWLAYGAILDHLKNRPDLLEKIKGCVVDSGADPNLDPKVWAAGFSTALLKKSSSATCPSLETGGSTQLGSGNNGSQIEEKKPFFIETLLLVAFEKLFNYLLNMPDVNRRLTRIITVLSKSQPQCPQLYLYSTGDKVIPFQRVEAFMEEQRMTGKQVFSFNFSSSPHVDHYRTFPDLYASQLDNFLKECLIMVVKS